MPKKSLLDDEGDDGDLQLDLKVNEEYAARLQHNKEREAWHRLKEKNPQLAARIEASSAGIEVEGQGEEDADSSTSEDEDEGEDAVDEQDQLRFLSVLSKIKQRDRSIYEPVARVYPDEEDGGGSSSSDEQQQPRSARQQKPARLKDVLARQALEGDAGSSGDEEESAEPRAAGPTYVEEQEELRQAFLQEVAKEEAGEGEDDAFGGVLKPKRRILPEPSNAAAGERADDGQQTQALLDAYFGTDEALPEDERFLKDYISKQGWIDRGDLSADFIGDDDVEEDEQYLEAAERFEAQYNLRFEEPGAANVITYPRNLEGIVRKKDDRRKLQREARAARKAEEAAAQAEEIKRLKSHKRREMDERLARIREVSGSDAAERMLAEVLGKADLDLDEYDRAMQAAFGDSYYQAEDEVLGEPDLDAGSDGDDGAAPRLPPVPEIDDGDAPGDADAKEEDVLEGGGIDDAAIGASGRADLERLVEDYHRLDAQDYVGGVPCRFHYREVPPTTYGLSIAEVLALPDKELNQVVGMKRLAPYRDDGGVTRPNYGKLRELQAASRHPLRKKKRKAEQAAGASLWVEREAPAGAQRRREQGAPESKDGDEAQSAADAVVKPRKKAKKASKEAAGAEGQRQQHGAVGGAEQGNGVEGVSRGDDEARKAAQSRLASFARPTLSKPDREGAAKKKKKKNKAGAPPPVSESASAAEQHLTKAQRKNRWRQRRRESLKRAQEAAAAQ